MRSRKLCVDSAGKYCAGLTVTLKVVPAAPQRDGPPGYSPVVLEFARTSSRLGRFRVPGAVVMRRRRAGGSDSARLRGPRTARLDQKLSERRAETRVSSAGAQVQRQWRIEGKSVSRRHAGTGRAMFANPVDLNCKSCIRIRSKHVVIENGNNRIREHCLTPALRLPDRTR